MAHQSFYIWTQLWMFTSNMVFSTFLHFIRDFFTPHLPCLTIHPLTLHHSTDIALPKHQQLTPTANIQGSLTVPDGASSWNAFLLSILAIPSWFSCLLGYSRTPPSALHLSHSTPFLKASVSTLITANYLQTHICAHWHPYWVSKYLLSVIFPSPTPAVPPVFSLSANNSSIHLATNQNLDAAQIFSFLNHCIQWVIKLKLPQSCLLLSPPLLLLLWGCKIHPRVSTPSNPPSTLLSVSVPKCNLILFLPFNISSTHKITSKIFRR